MRVEVKEPCHLEPRPTKGDGPPCRYRCNPWRKVSENIRTHTKYVDVLDARSDGAEPVLLDRRSHLRFVNPAPAGHGALNRNVDQRHGIHFKRIAAQHHEVRQFPRSDAALAV